MTFEELFENQGNGEIARRIRGKEALQALFGSGLQGAREALSRVESAGPSVLDFIDHDTALKYHEIARRSVFAAKDKTGVQEQRRILMESALKHQVSK